VTALQCATTLIVARHGEAEYEVSEWDDAEGGSLTALGRRQAVELAESLASARVAHVWTSTLARAVQTAEIVAARLGVGVTTRVGLREFGAGDLDEERDLERWQAIWERWLAGDLETVIPGGESGRQIADRYRAVLREAADLHPGETVLVVTHGGVTSIGVPAVARMTGPARQLGNCETVEIRADADAWVCTRWGQVEPSA